MYKVIFKFKKNSNLINEIIYIYILFINWAIIYIIYISNKNEFNLDDLNILKYLLFILIYVFFFKKKKLLYFGIPITLNILILECYNFFKKKNLFYLSIT